MGGWDGLDRRCAGAGLPKERNNDVIRLRMETPSRRSLEQPFVLVNRSLLQPSAGPIRS
jgi:hypothetical protein